MHIKQELRTDTYRKILALSEEERFLQSQRVSKQIISYIKIHAIQTVLLYCALDQEVNVDQVIERCRENEVTVLLPKVIGDTEIIAAKIHNWSELDIGAFGVREPINIQAWTGTIDLAVIPGLAFDKQGNRLGKGKAYFDRFLLECMESYKIGVCFREQIVENIPIEEWDVQMDEIISS